MTCPAPRHGTYSAYRKGCRCPVAREDWRLYYKRRKQGRAQPLLISAAGTRRRIEALEALGWTGAQIAAAAGLHARRPGAILGFDRVTTTTADAIERAYDLLSMRIGPSVKTRARAAAKGWAPPLAWDDDEIDDPDARPAIGEPGDVDDVHVRLNRAERTAAIRTLHGRHLNDEQIAARLHMTTAAVCKHRARHLPETVQRREKSAA